MPRRSCAFILGLGVLAIALTGCSGGVRKAGHGSKPVASVKPSRTIAGPAGLLSAGPPQPNGTIWTLSGHGKVRTLDALNLSTGNQQAAVGATATATSVTQSSSGQLALGVGSANVGAVEILNGSSATAQSTIPVGAPVRAVSFGDNGNTLYALNGTAKSASVSVIDTSTGKVVKTVPVPVDATSLVPAADQQTVWTVQRSGTVQSTSLKNGRALAAFSVGDPAISVTLSPTGNELYVLKGTRAKANIAEIKVATESMQKVLPAAAHSVGLQLSLNGAQLYDVVGGAHAGNIQLITP